MTSEYAGHACVLNGSIAIEELRAQLRYVAETGHLYWLKRGPMFGKKAGNSHRSGYTYIKVNDRLYSAHRLVWAIVKGCWPAAHLDHINGDKIDNRIENLREVTQRQNCQNQRRPRVSSTSGLLGVITHKRNGRRFEARICVAGKRHQLGFYFTAEEAHEAYRSAAASLRGESFAPTMETA
jgi:hypothetical protein